MSEAVNVYGPGTFGLSQAEATRMIWQILLSARDGQFPLSVSATTTPSSPTTRTLAASTVTTSGSVTAGARSVLMVFSSDFTGTVLGVTVDKAQSPSMAFTADENGLVPAIAYTVGAGNINIFKMT